MYISNGVVFNFEKNIVFWLKVVFTFANRVVHNEMQHYAAFIRVFIVCKMNPLRVSRIQRVKWYISTFSHWSVVATSW